MNGPHNGGNRITSSFQVRVRICRGGRRPMLTPVALHRAGLTPSAARRIVRTNR